MSAERNFKRLIERLADTGRPVQLDAQDLATILAHEPTLLVDVARDPAVARSIIDTLRGGPDLTIETAACIGAAIAGALKAKSERYASCEMAYELRSRRFNIGSRSTVGRSTH